MNKPLASIVSPVPIAALAILAVTACAQPSDALSGDWQSECQDFSQTHISFGDDASTAVKKTTLFANPDCTDLSSVWITSSRVEFAGEIGSAEQGEAIDFHVVDFTVTSQSEANTQGFNTRQFGGHTDWSIGVPKDMLDRPGDGGGVLVPANSESLGIYAITEDSLVLTLSAYGHNPIRPTSFAPASPGEGPKVVTEYIRIE